MGFGNLFKNRRKTAGRVTRTKSVKEREGVEQESLAGNPSFAALDGEPRT